MFTSQTVNIYTCPICTVLVHCIVLLLDLVRFDAFLAAIIIDILNESNLCYFISVSVSHTDGRDKLQWYDSGCNMFICCEWSLILEMQTLFKCINHPSESTHKEIFITCVTCLYLVIVSVIKAIKYIFYVDLAKISIVCDRKHSDIYWAILDLRKVAGSK